MGKIILLLWLIFSLLVANVITSAQTIMQKTRDFLDSNAQLNPDQVNSRFARENGFEYIPMKPIKTYGIGCTMPKKVFAWTYKQSKTVYDNYQWNLLTDLSYFSYSVDSDGKPTNPTEMAGLKTNDMVLKAKSEDVNVNLAFAMSKNVSAHTILSNSIAQDTLINRLYGYVVYAQMKGVNVDLENLSNSDKANFTYFIQKLYNKLHPAGKEVSITLQGSYVTANYYDFNNLNNYSDYYILMGYDFFWQSVSKSGPTDPLYKFLNTANGDIASTLDSLLSKNILTNRILLGLPCYGYDWATQTNQLNSTTTSSGKVIYYYNRNNYLAYTTLQQDAQSLSPYYIYAKNSIWHQAFINSDYTIGERMDIVNYRSLGGIGLWEISQLGNDTAYWYHIQNKFSSCNVVPQIDTIYDMGGPLLAYNKNENYTYTVSPTNATKVTLKFLEFNTQLNKDTLTVYDGVNTSYPLLGKFSGATLPPVIISSGNSVTIKFVSNNDKTVGSGFKIEWSSSNDNSYNNPIAAWEFWFDNDYAHSVGANTVSNDQFNFSQSISTSLLSQGLHSFHIHFQDLNGKWSSVVSQFFVKLPQTGITNSIAGYEYWFDDNYSSKVFQSITLQQNYQLLAGISATGLSQGLHSFHIRFQDAGNVWSEVLSQFVVYVPAAPSGSKIKSYEYWYDNYYTQKVSVNISSPTEIYILNKGLPTTGLGIGTHTLNIRFRQSNNLWSSLLSQSFTKNAAGTVANISVSSNNLQFTNSNPFFVYPNPSTGKFNVGLDDDAGIWSLKITNSSGQIVYSKESIEDQRMLQIDLSNMPAGVYIVSAWDGEKNFDEKIVISR